ncbi:MAG: hypothetical protein HYX74_11080 [Acidobacteria bacterium]|nr:hypothetical protein [Acidobacteriota bacterium]
MEGIVPLLPILILVTGLMLVLGLKRLAGGTLSAHLSLFSAVLALCSVLYTYYQTRSQSVEFALGDWPMIPGQQLTLTYRVDSWSALFAGLALGTVLAALLLRTRLWLAFPHRTSWTDVYLLALAVVFTHLAYSASAILITASWICLGLVTCLGCATSSRESAVRAAAYKVLVITCLSGGALLAATVLIGRAAGFDATLIDLAPAQVSLPAFLLLVAALAAYAGVFPLHVWATDLGSIPSTFASAGSLLTGVAAIYLLGRTSFLFAPGPDSPFSTILLALGLASVVYGSISALVESDFKRMLRHVCTVEMGFAFVALGLGSAIALAAATLIAVNLCLSGGAVALYVLELRGRGIGGETSPISHSPLELGLALAALGSLVGLPPLLGFFARWMLYNAAVEIGYAAVAIVGVLASSLVAVPLFKWADHLLFSRTHPCWNQARRAGLLSLSAIALLQLPALAAGFLPWPSLQHVVVPALAASWAGEVYGEVFNGFARLPVGVQVATALAVLLPFGVALKLYPFPIGQTRLRSSGSGATDQSAEPFDRPLGVRVSVQMAAESLSRMLNPEWAFWIVRRSFDAAGVGLFALSQRLEERYYFVTLVLLGIAVVLIFLG